MPLTAEQTTELENRRKMTRGCPKFDPERIVWRSFESSFREWTLLTGIAGMGLEGQPEEFLSFTKVLLATVMSGSAIERTRPYRSGTAAFDACATLEDYIVLLRGVFQPPAESRSLKQEFDMYRQKPEEDCSTYLSTKLSLFDLAYVEGQRDFDVLLTSVINGLYSNIVKRQLRRQTLTTREQLRGVLFDIVSKEREAYYGNYSEATSLDGLAAVTQHFTRNSTVPRVNNNNQVEDMEVDALQEQIAALQAKLDTRKGGKACFTCNKTGHFSRNCPNKDKKDPKGQGSGSKLITCHYCSKKGHKKAECRKRKKDLETAKGGKAKSGVKTMGSKDDKSTVDIDSSESEDEETVGFLGARGVVFH